MPFRLEYALSGRAGCKATECKKQGIKIDKGELRHGTFLEIQEHQSWAWKHWGCVTPVQIANLKTDIDGNLDYLDGYEDLNDDDKAKVRQALGDGHVADEDWRYDVEMNRPGKKGFRSPAYKAQQKADKKAVEQQDSSATHSQPLPKERSQSKTEDDGEEEGVTKPVVKKKRARVKKESNIEIEVHNDAEEASQMSRSRLKKETINEVNYDTSGQEESRKLRAALTKIKEEAIADNAPNLDITVPKKAKRQAKKPGAKVKMEVFKNEDDMADAEVSDEAMLPGKSTSNGKKSAPKVKPEVVDKEGIKDDIQESNGANQAVKAKSGRKRKLSAIGGPAKTVDPSNPTEAKPNTSTRVTRSRTK